MSNMLTKYEIQGQHAASKFNDVNYMRSHHPALFSTEAHPKMSERYAFTHTYDIVDALQKKDYGIATIQGGYNRFDQLLVRMRHRQYIDTDVRHADGAPELIIIDSHDGSKALKLALGYIRFVCMNGCIAGDLLYHRSFRHNSRDLMTDVMIEVLSINSYVASLTQSVDAMRQYRTTIGDRLRLADIATIQRFGDDRDETFKLHMRNKLLTRRRREDTAEDLHTVVNVIQENSLRGGFSYDSRPMSPRGRMMRARPVNSINTNVKLNTALWNEATTIMQRAA